MEYTELVMHTINTARNCNTIREVLDHLGALEEETGKLRCWTCGYTRKDHLNLFCPGRMGKKFKLNLFS